MNDAQKQATNKVLEALSFYANSDIYWGEPIPLDTPTCRDTLRICLEHNKKSQINQDRGEIARQALYEYEGAFDCHYEIRTEP